MRRRCVTHGTVLADLELPKLPAVLVEGGSVCLSKEKSQVHQFLASLYLANLKESLAAAPKAVGSIFILFDDLDGKADWYFADSTGGLELGIPAIICEAYGLLHEARSVISKFIPLSVADI